MRQALYYMGQHKIPIDPLNYTLWYEHVSGRNRELSETIDDLLARRQPFSEELNRSLYKEYIESRNKRIMEHVRSQLRLILTQLLDAGDNFERYGDIMQNFVERLAVEVPAAEMEEMLDDILSETRATSFKGSSLNSDLNSSIREMEILRQDLAFVQGQANTDSLTGLANRRFFEAQLLGEMRKASLNGGDLCLLMIDLDHFKEVNDRHGHLMGDQVLKQLAEILNDLVKGRDLAVRIGGEEFVVLLPETPLLGASALANNICLYVEAFDWSRLAEELKITVSIGVARFQAGEDKDGFIKRADDALYAAKNGGRNRAVSA